MPLLPDLSSYRGDESLYTDAAIGMIDQRDWLTPRYVDGKRDGQVRLNKPIISYWLIAGSLQILPDGFFAARLPFLLCGAGVVVMTWLMARRMFGNGRAALIASLVMTSNPELWATSIRSMPDIVLTVFMAVSAYGCLALLTEERPAWRHYACAYLGAALAVQSKGVLGILPVGLAWIVGLAARERPFRRLFSPTWIILAMMLGSGWFIAVYLCHGNAVLKQFFSDQVGERLRDIRIFANFLKYLGAYARHFLPWLLLIIPIAIGAPRILTGLFRRHRTGMLYLLSFWAICLLIFTCGNMDRSRYLLPSYPMVAVILAGAIDAALSEKRLHAWILGFNWILVAAGVTAGAILIAYGFRLEPILIAGGAGLVLVSLVAAWTNRRWSDTGALASLGLLPLLFFATSSVTVRRWAEHSPVQDWRSVILESVPPGTRIETMGLESEFTSHLRLVLHGRNTVKAVKAPTADVVILGPKAADPEGYEVRDCGYENDDLTESQIKSILLGDDPAAIAEERAIIYRLAVK